MSLGDKVLAATDLSEPADEAIRAGHERARAANGELVVCHVIPNPLRHSPLFPQRQTEDTAGLISLQKQAIEAVSTRVRDLAGHDGGSPPEAGPAGRDDGSFRVVVESGAASTAIVNLADAIK